MPDIVSVRQALAVLSEYLEDSCQWPRCVHRREPHPLRCKCVETADDETPYTVATLADCVHCALREKGGPEA